jgi:hypothetical protein
MEWRCMGGARGPEEVDLSRCTCGREPGEQSARRRAGQSVRREVSPRKGTPDVGYDRDARCRLAADPSF